MTTLKKLEREIKKLALEIGQRTTNVEIVKATSPSDKRKKIKILEKKYEGRHGWLYVMEPYKYSTFKEEKNTTQERIKKYMSCLGEEFGPHGSTV